MENQPKTRIEPLLPPQWDEVALDALGAFPRSLEFVLNRWNNGGVDVRGLNVLGVMARHPPLAKAFMTFNAHVSGASTLSVRERELMILRISWLRQSEYEYMQHVILGLRAGLTEAEIDRVQLGPDALGWDANDADLVRAVDELKENARIEAPTWARLAQRYSIPQLMDLVFVVGCYEILAMAINSFDTQQDPGVAPLDPAIKARMLAQTE